MNLFIIFAISAVLLQYHFAATAPGQGEDEYSSESSSSVDSSLADIPIPDLPKELDNYEVIKVIGEGGFGIVISATHKGTQKVVAIKIIDKTQPGVKKNPQMLTNEPDNMEGLDHPNIVKLFQVADTDKYLFLVMENVSGGEISAHFYKLIDERMTEVQARSKFRQIVLAIQYLHQNNIVHRDLKIDNVLLDKSKKNIKLADFGLSEQFISGSKLDTFLGSRNHMAPEILKKEMYDGPKADVWSLGIILHEILTGRQCFSCITDDDVIKRINRGYNAPVFLTKECKDLLHKIIVVNPEKRASLEEIMKDPWMNIGHEHDILKPYVEPELDRKHQDEIKKGYEKEEIKASISRAEYDNDVFAAYLILGGKIPKAHGLAHSGGSIPASENSNAAQVGTASQSHKRNAPSPNSSKSGDSLPNKKQQTTSHGKHTL